MTFSPKKGIKRFTQVNREQMFMIDLFKITYVIFKTNLSLNHVFIIKHIP